MGKLTTILCDRPLAYAPEWVHLLPSGELKTRDGRQFLNDAPEGIIAAFKEGGIELPVDYEHQNDRPAAKLSGPVPAAGWIKELNLRPDGLWARVDWTDRARALIANREYRFLSPSLLVDKLTRRVMRLKGAGLVHAPNLHLAALNSQETDMEDEIRFAMQIAQLLGLDEEAEPEDILAALKETLNRSGKPDPRKYVPVEALQEAMAERSQEQVSMSEDRARAKVDDAFRKGYLTSAAKGWALELCLTDPDSFDRFLKSTAPAYGHLLQPSHRNAEPPSAGQAIAASPEVELLSSQLGLSKDVFLRK
jgi:phage I-like protein